MKNYFLIFVFFLSPAANAQSWNNLIYNDNQPGLEANPLKGFVDLFNPSNNFPQSIGASLFGLDEVMIGMDNFDWTVIDAFLAQEAAKGHHSYIQVNIDPANGSTDMPAFLVGQVAFEDYPGDPSNNIPPDLCPNWNDPNLMSAMLNFINAFGAKYNDDARVFMVHLGLYGMWGEWHIGELENIRPEFEMTEANRLLIANAYINAFPDKVLLARYPEHMPDPQAFGYSDGLFFEESISTTNPFYFHNILKAYHSDQAWRLHPVGGEISPPIQATIWDHFPNQLGQDVYQCFDSIHPTWLFSHHVFTALAPNTQEWDNVIRAQKAMGYTFYVEKSRFAATAGKPSIEVNLQNKGISPIYANWDIEFGVQNSSNQFQSLGFTKWDIDLIQPDNDDNYRSYISDTVLADGTYTFLMRIVNPLESLSPNAKAVSFANNSQDQDIDGWLSLGSATIVAGNAGNPITKVSNISLSQSTAIMSVGDNLQLSAVVSPALATNSDITWVSAHPGTASVSANGYVSAGPSYGEVVIAAITQDGGLRAECIISVEPISVNLPAQIEAEDYIGMTGIVVEASSEGSDNLGYIDNNDWMEYSVSVGSPSDFFVDYRVASPSGGGEISLINESGNTLSVITVPNTNGWQTYTTISTNSVSLPTGSYTLRILASKGGFNLNWLEFRFDKPTPVESLNYSDQIHLYPNPTQNKIRISWDQNSTIQALPNIKVLNVWGETTSAYLSDDDFIDLSHLPNGIYFLAIEFKGQRVIKKIIKN